MRDRNIFAELPIEESNEKSTSVNNSLESPTKRSFRKKIKKSKPVNNTSVTNASDLDINDIKEFSKLSLNHITEQENDMKSDKVCKKPKPTSVNNIAKITHKNVTGADNWKTFLETTAPATSDLKDKNLSLNIEYKDECISRKKLSCVAMDCEMVGIGEDKKENMLARVSIVNSLGECVYDTFVKPTATITDYRTAVSGVRPCDLVNAEKFTVVQKKVLEILRGKVLVGHAVHNDLIVLKIRHPRYLIRDTSRYKKFYQIGVGTPSLKKLTSHFLNVDIQTGEHNSIQDAQAAMQLYMLYRKEWEADVKQHRHSNLRYRSKKKPKQTNKTKKKHRNY